MKTVFNEPDANTGCYRSDKQRCRGRIIGLMLIATLFVAMSAELAAQPHQGNWIHRNASDTSFVFCLNDRKDVSDAFL